MWIRGTFPVLALILSGTIGIVMTGCSSGGDDAPAGQTGATAPPGGVAPPAPATQGNVIFGRTTAGNDDLFLIRTDGSGLVTLAADPAARETFSRLAGNRVIFHKGPPGFSPRDIWGVNQDGTGGSALVNTASDEFARGVVNNVLVYEVSAALGGQRDLASIGVDGSNNTTLASNVVDDEYFVGTAGGRVLYEQRTGNLTDLFSILPDGSGIQPLGIGPNEEFLVGVTGAQVIFARRADSFSQTDLFLINADGSGQVPLAATPANEIFSAVVGNRVVFERCVPQGGQCDLYSVNLDGSNEVPLATSNDNEFFAGATGTRVLYTVNVGGQTDLFSVDVNGGGPSVPLATSNINNEFAEGFVGSRVIFRREIGPQTDLFSIDASGGVETPLATGPTRESFAGAIGNLVIFERLADAGFASPSDVLSRVADGSAPEVPLAVTPDDEEYQGESGGRAIFERRTGAGPRDLFSIPPDGSGSAVPLGQTANDEFFVASF